MSDKKNDREIKWEKKELDLPMLDRLLDQLREAKGMLEEKKEELEEEDNGNG